MHDLQAAGEAMVMLDEMGALYRVVSDHQIKIGRYVSYYPSTGRIFIDGEKGARPEKGCKHYARSSRNAASCPNRVEVERKRTASPKR